MKVIELWTLSESESVSALGNPWVIMKVYELLWNLEAADQLVHVVRWAVDQARHILRTRLKVTCLRLVHAEQNATRIRNPFKNKKLTSTKPHWIITMSTKKVHLKTNHLSMLLWFGVKSPARKCRPGLSNCLVEVSCEEGHEGHGHCNCHASHSAWSYYVEREGRGDGR